MKLQEIIEHNKAIDEKIEKLMIPVHALEIYKVHPCKHCHNLYRTTDNTPICNWITECEVNNNWIKFTENR